MGAKRWRYTLVLTLLVSLGSFSDSAAQGIGFGVGGENVESESSLIPFRVQPKGILNDAAKGASLGVVSLWINDYREGYKFDVTIAQALDYPNITAWSILQKYKNGKGVLKLIGPPQLLSKVGQAEPGSPLTLVGFLRQRDEVLQLTTVERLGTDEPVEALRPSVPVEERTDGE